MSEHTVIGPLGLLYNMTLCVGIFFMSYEMACTERYVPSLLDPEADYGLKNAGLYLGSGIRRLWLGVRDELELGLGA